MVMQGIAFYGGIPMTLRDDGSLQYGSGDSYLVFVRQE